MDGNDSTFIPRGLPVTDRDAWVFLQAMAWESHALADDESALHPCVVISHVRPDADTVGSACALVHLIRRWGGTAVAVDADGGVPSSAFSVLNTEDVYVPLEDIPRDPIAVVCVDTASLDRCGVAVDMVERATEKGRSLVIDHHETATNFGSINWVHPDADSTTTMLTSLCDMYSETIDRTMATAFYAGLVTDTESFRWGGPTQFATAHRLASTGIDTRSISSSLIDDHSVPYLRMLGAVLSDLVYEPSAVNGRGLAWGVVTDSQAQEAVECDVESVIDVVRTASEAEVAMVLKEYRPGEIVVSLRSRGAVNVARVAEELGGGGHAQAAGLTWQGTRDSFMDAFRQRVNQEEKNGR